MPNSECGIWNFKFDIPHLNISVGYFRFMQLPGVGEKFDFFVLIFGKVPFIFGAR